MKKPIKSLITMLLVISLLMSNFAMIFTYAAIQDYPVELAFNNIFVFDKWAGNSLSTTMVNGGGPVKDELDINIEDGSFRFNNQYSTESYTGHGMATGGNAAGNYQYYYMEVEPNAAYTFSYNVTQTTAYITPYVFFFNENNEYISLVAQPFAGNGDTSFAFIAPSNAKYIQIRFTLPGTGYADVKDIAIRKTEVASYGNNLFDFDAWAGNANSGKVSVDAAYNGGTISTNTTDNSVTLTTNGNPVILFTNFTFGNGNGYYMMDVEPNTRYNFSYNLDSCNFAVGAYKPYVAFYRADGEYISYINSAAVSLGTNRFVFTTPADAEYIQIVYGVEGAEAGKSCTVKDVAIQKINLAENTNEDLPHRLVYTYSKNTVNTYGELPVPSYAPTGYVFAGWYTAPNGEGSLITKDTAVHYSSYTVYPKYEPIATSLTVKEAPVKKAYTVGERVNPTGLVLEANISGNPITITSGYYCTPEYLTATGTQTVTAHYGGKTATFTVNVSASASRSVVINGSNVNASVTNNVYTFNYTTNAFNHYEMTYFSDAYVKGVMTYTDGVTEEFFLEPSSNFDGTNGEFASYIDGYLKKILEGDNKTKEVTSTTRNGIRSIAFELLDNKSGTFELLSVNTSKKADISLDTTKYFNNSKYKVGIDILNGGVVNYIEVLNSNIVARVYTENGRNITRVDYADKLPDGHISESKNVNLINYYDNGRELQQSYYGTGEKPYEQGYYNRADWNYNPVQGGNVIGEASKVIDYDIGDDYIYVKTRPLDWSKWSDDFANLSSTDAYDPKYGDEYVTDTYVESKYVFEDGMIKAYNRMVDYSGYPSAQTTQELPAFYTIEPLNQYVYNDVSEDEAWKTKNLTYDPEPEFWGIAQEYKEKHYPNGFDANRNTPEHWAAFMASEDPASFGIGLYSPEVTNFFYGVYPQKYAENIVNGEFQQTDILNYRHAQTVDPAAEDDSSYIAPVEVRTFESFKPTEYSYYISTGTVDQIRNSFGVVDDEEFAAELNSGSIAVPETIYMQPNGGESKAGQYYVNNILDKETNAVTPEAKNNNTNAYVQFYVPGAKDVTIAVNTLTSGIGDIVLNEAVNIQSGNLTLSYEGMSLGSVIDADGFFYYPSAGLYINGTGLKPGQIALAEWVFTITMDDGSVRTYYAYSTLYSPHRSVGAVSESRRRGNDNNELSTWVSGINVAPNGTWSPVAHGHGDKSAAGYFKYDPLWNGLPGGGSSESVDDFIIASSTEQYVEAKAPDGADWTKAISYLGYLTVDSSRYTNTNQIPNFKIGWDALRVNDNRADSLGGYKGWWVFGDASKTIGDGEKDTPSGWNEYFNRGEPRGTVRDTHVPSIDVSTINGMYVHVANQGYCDYLGTLRYANAYSSVKFTTVNKANLRDLVLKASSLNKANYTTDSWNAMITELRTAAQALGNPSNSDIATATTNLQNKMNALQTVVTLNANGGSIGTTSFNATVGSALTPDYNLSAYTPTRTGYTFMGWSTDKNATEGSTTTVKAGLMPTLYAVWSENSYTVKFNANGGSGFVADKTVKYTNSFTLPSYEFTKDKYTLLGWSTSASATTATYSPGQTVDKLKTENGDVINLYAVWKKSSFNVTFDNLIDFDAWNKTAHNGTVSDVTDTGFTVTCNDGAGEGTSSSPYFPVEPGKQYKINIDITGTAWDVYIFFCDANGNWIDFVDGPTGRFSSAAFAGMHTDHVFTAPNKSEVVKAQIRVDANGSNNAVTFNNIRVYEYNGQDINVEPVNKFVKYGDTLGTLPTPTKVGYDFVGWYSGDVKYTSSSEMKTESTLELTSKWEISNNALTSDAYVLDFGLAVEMKPLENDTVLTSDGGNYSISGISKDGGNTASNSVQGEYGTFTVKDANTVRYVPTKTMDGPEVIYYHVSYNNGAKTLVNTITVIPATVVYYEDDVKSLINYIDGKASSGTTGTWDIVGESKTDSAVQSVADDVYGYDDVYAKATDTYSMGSAHMVSVSQKNNPQAKYNGVAENAGSWPVAQFTFAGTGFDVVSLISQDTGLITVKVFAGTDVTKSAVKTWAVDTYYGYTYTDGDWTVTENDSNALYQIPVIGVTDLDYGTYTVQIEPTYTSLFDHKKDNSYDFCLDAIRVYNPCEFSAENSSIYGKYAADGEYALENKAIRDILINAGDLDATKASTGVVYINAGKTEGTFEDYSKTGPKNEVYLDKGQSIAFNMTVKGSIPTSVQISAHALNGTASMRFGSGSDYSDAINISHKTTMYYEIPFMGSSYWHDNGDGSYTTNSPIVITNNGDGLLSLCNIKVTSEQLMQMEEEPVMFMMSRRSFAVAAEIAEDMSGLSPEDGALFIPDSVEAETDAETVVVGGNVVVTVTTSGDVASLTVNGENADLVSENEDGTKTWSFTYTADSNGAQTITLVAFNEYGYASESTELTVDVESRFEHFFTQLKNFFNMIVEFFKSLFNV